MKDSWTWNPTDCAWERPLRPSEAREVWLLAALGMTLWLYGLVLLCR